MLGSIPGGEKEIIFLSETSRPTLGPKQPPVHLALRSLSRGIKRPECEADQSRRSCADEGNEWSCLHCPICLHCLYRDNFICISMFHVFQSLSEGVW